MYIVNYDIPSDKKRTKIASILEGYGKRVQYSSFECRISTKQFADLQQKLKGVMNQTEGGNIRIYQLCACCEEKIEVLGNAVAEKWEEVYVI